MKILAAVFLIMAGCTTVNLKGNWNCVETQEGIRTRVTCTPIADKNRRDYL